MWMLVRMVAVEVVGNVMVRVSVRIRVIIVTMTMRIL